ncbi:hypothetical protein NC797_11055 [Aquibacillus sp. 3ASR75-11]|uniref:Uncharacterized protein n=1 Tax=Terrihalobacillus insolitus TaxID=2950438 RepID=A0A9X3WUW8_9BACI|nr:hypothetical protein [Terrihalobacillus insolitus]MDC3411780.1 hypothetical protein [Terrihalobacillus insolitus]MDC3425043.1 hypothetical protein [Terrihalobacillus insolitus]
MNVTSTLDMEEAVLRDFFEGKWDTFVDKESLHACGYLVDYQGQYQAFFALAPVVDGGYWLKSLYIKEGVPTTFPLTIIESSITLAKEKRASSLYVYSHQSALDRLLSILQFMPQEQPSFSKEIEAIGGNWWVMDIDNDLPTKDSTTI